MANTKSGGHGDTRVTWSLPKTPSKDGLRIINRVKSITQVWGDVKDDPQVGVKLLSSAE